MILHWLITKQVFSLLASIFSLQMLFDAATLHEQVGGSKPRGITSVGKLKWSGWLETHLNSPKSLHP